MAVNRRNPRGLPRGFQLDNFNSQLENLVALQTVVICIIDDSQNVTVGAVVILLQNDPSICIVLTSSGGLFSQRNLIQRRTFHTFLLVVVDCDVYAILVHRIGVAAAVKLNSYIAFLNLLNTGDCNSHGLGILSCLNIDEISTVIGVDKDITSRLRGAVAAIILQGYVLRTSPSLVYGGLIVVLAVGALVRIRGHICILVVRASTVVLSLSNYNCNANSFNTVRLLGCVVNSRTVLSRPIIYGLTRQNLYVLLNVGSTGNGIIQCEYYCTIIDRILTNLVLCSNFSILAYVFVTSLIRQRGTISSSASTQSLQGVSAVAASRVGEQVVNRLVVICKAVLRSYIFCIFTRGQRQLLNLDGLGRAVQEVSLYLLSGAALHAVLCGLKVSYNQNVVGRRLGLLGIYNVIANDSKVIGAARLDGSSIVCYVGSTVGSNLVPSIVYLKLSKYDGKKLVTSATTPDANQVKADDVLITSGASAKGLVTFTKLSDDTYDIEFVSTTNKAGCDDYITTGSVKVDDKKIDNKPVNDDAVIYVEASTEIKVISGKSIKNWDNKTADSTVLLTNEKNGLDYVAAGYVEVSGAKVPGATADTKYGYLTRDGYTVTVNGEKKAAYEVWTNEGAKTLVEDASAPIAGATTGKVISYTIDGDYINDVSLEGLDAAIIGTDRTEKGTAKIATGGAATTGTYTFDDDCVFVAVDDSENEGAEGGIEAIPTAQKCVGSNYVANAIVVLKNDGTVATPDYKIVAVFYDVDNMLDRNTDTDTVVTDSHVHFAG